MELTQNNDRSKMRSRIRLVYNIIMGIGGVAYAVLAVVNHLEWYDYMLALFLFMGSFCGLSSYLIERINFHSAKTLRRLGDIFLYLFLIGLFVVDVFVK